MTPPWRCPYCFGDDYRGCYDCQFTGLAWGWLIDLDLSLNDFRYWLRWARRPHRDCPDCGTPLRRWWRELPGCDCPPF